MSSLQNAFDADSFRRRGHALIDTLSQYLEETQSGDLKTNEWTPPEELYTEWKNKDTIGTMDGLVTEVLHHSIRLQNPRYMGHQVSVPAPDNALIDMVISLLNNGSAIYEMGAVGTVVERLLSEWFLELFHWQGGDGFFTSGGTLANLTALLAARRSKATDDVWLSGTTEQYGVMVSAEAHYCVDRAARILGWGSEGVIKVPVDSSFRMRTDLLEQYYTEAKQKGIQVLAVVGSAPSTSTGIYDDLESIAEFCKTRQLWFHIDGAHGGSAIVSEKYKHYLKGADQADSIIIDAHKMMLVPALCTAVLFKNKIDSYSNFQMEAQYLWEQKEQFEWYNLANRTFECTKQMYALKLFALKSIYGAEIFEEFINRMYDLTRIFYQYLMEKPDFEILVEPNSNILCFRYFDAELDEEQLNMLNQRIRRSVLEGGDFYIVMTTVKGKSWLRVTLMNPRTQLSDLEALIERITEHALVEIKR